MRSSSLALFPCLVPNQAVVLLVFAAAERKIDRLRCECQGPGAFDARLCLPWRPEKRVGMGKSAPSTTENFPKFGWKIGLASIWSGPSRVIAIEPSAALAGLGYNGEQDEGSLDPSSTPKRLAAKIAQHSKAQGGGKPTASRFRSPLKPP
jgi:hypothetical protein